MIADAPFNADRAGELAKTLCEGFPKLTGGCSATLPQYVAVARRMGHRLTLEENIRPTWQLLVPCGQIVSLSAVSTLPRETGCWTEHISE